MKTPGPTYSYATSIRLSISNIDRVGVGKFDERIANYRKQLELDREYLADLESGKRTLSEDHRDGRGRVDVTDEWIERMKLTVKVLEDQIEDLEKLDAEAP